MFEKDAEKYYETETPMIENITGLDFQNEVIKAFQEGAEFGYNKANEWHYVKDGDYPKDNKPVLCILGDIDSDYCKVGYYNDDESGEPWHFETYYLPDDSEDDWGVSAWKEIVLPELPKEDE